jgi:hypothetical protein
MYKLIWGLVFKWNGSGRQFNSIQFSQEYNNQRNERKKKEKRLNNRVRLIMHTFLGFLTSNNWGWAETLKNNFTLIELDPLHKNEIPSLSVTRVTTHSK